MQTNIKRLNDKNKSIKLVSKYNFTIVQTIINDNPINSRNGFDRI